MTLLVVTPAALEATTGIVATEVVEPATATGTEVVTTAEVAPAEATPLPAAAQVVD